jgi:hypothetical protein
MPVLLAKSLLSPGIRLRVLQHVVPSFVDFSGQRGRGRGWSMKVKKLAAGGLRLVH